MLKQFTVQEVQLHWFCSLEESKSTPIDVSRSLPCLQWELDQIIECLRHLTMDLLSYRAFHMHMSLAQPLFFLCIVKIKALHVDIVSSAPFSNLMQICCLFDSWFANYVQYLMYCHPFRIGSDSINLKAVYVKEHWKEWNVYTRACTHITIHTDSTIKKHDCSLLTFIINKEDQWTNYRFLCDSILSMIKVVIELSLHVFSLVCTHTPTFIPSQYNSDVNLIAYLY